MCNGGGLGPWDRPFAPAKMHLSPSCSLFSSAHDQQAAQWHDGSRLLDTEKLVVLCTHQWEYAQKICDSLAMRSERQGAPVLIWLLTFSPKLDDQGISLTQYGVPRRDRQ